jgi:hypothetical protein
MKFSLARLDSVLDQLRMSGATTTRIRGPKMAMDLLSQEMAGRDGPSIEKVEVDGKTITTYLGIPIGVDDKMPNGLYCVLEMERRVP